MAAMLDGVGKDDIKTQFMTREGTYKLMHLSEYSKPTRVAFNGQANIPVKVSFVNVMDGSLSPDRICFNIGRELYFYVYKGIKKAADLTKPIDKRAYKGTLPTCHDFNSLTVTDDSVLLLVGFTAGQIQLIDPIKKEISKLYNEDRLIEKTKVTCIKWIPSSANQFLVSHSSGHMYLYNEEMPCGTTVPHQPFKQGEGYSITTCKTKTTRNPLYRWTIGQGAINEFAFSPCCKYLAVVSQDGYLRVFNYNSMDLVGSMKSYFGGILCICWSPDGKYVVTGGEDDLVTVWSFHEKRVVCRGEGHKSWVNVVAFDSFTSSFAEDNESCDFSGSDDDMQTSAVNTNNPHNSVLNPASRDSVLSNDLSHNKDSSLLSQKMQGSESKPLSITSYRFGSVGQDTMLCLWDLTEDVLKQPLGRTRACTVIKQTPSLSGRSNSLPHNQKNASVANSTKDASWMDGTVYPTPNAVIPSQKFATLSLGDKKDKDGHEKKDHKRNFSLASRSDKLNILKSNHVQPVDDSIKLLGTSACPRLDEAPNLEPFVCKKIAHERLTSIVFRDECIVTACQEGFVYTWARPGHMGLTQQQPSELLHQNPDDYPSK